MLLLLLILYIIIFFLLIIYAITLCMATYYWKKLPVINYKLSKDSISKNIKVAIIIAVRNEANNIHNLLTDLLLQTYPIAATEIIIINDHSTDNTAEIVKSYSQKHQHIILLNLPDNLQGKKQAISYGISQTNSELIMTTDGDCRLKPLWIASVCEFYQQKHAKLISSAVHLSLAPPPAPCEPSHRPSGRGFLTYSMSSSPPFGRCDGSQGAGRRVISKFGAIFQILDFAALIGIGAVSMHVGKPTMCNGANLAYTKEVFEEVGGFSGNEQIASGDDEFLLQKIAAKYPNDVHFLKNFDAIVHTETAKTMYSFFQQRKRWASKWKEHKQIQVKLVAIFVFAIHFCSLLLPIIAIFANFSSFSNFINFLWQFTIFFWSVKIATEMLFVSVILQFFRLSTLLYFMPFASLCYPFYAIIIGIASNQKGFEWKNRKY